MVVPSRAAMGSRASTTAIRSARIMGCPPGEPLLTVWACGARARGQQSWVKHHRAWRCALVLGRTVGEDGHPSWTDLTEIIVVYHLARTVHVVAVKQGPACACRVAWRDRVGSEELGDRGHHGDARRVTRRSRKLSLAELVALRAVEWPNKSFIVGPVQAERDRGAVIDGRVLADVLLDVGAHERYPLPMSRLASGGSRRRLPWGSLVQRTRHQGCSDVQREPSRPQCNRHQAG